MIPFSLSSKSIEIKYFKSVFFFSFKSFIISLYLFEYTIASTPERIIKLSISFSGNALSNGTIVPVPFTTAKYVTPHSYLFSPITATLLPSNPKLINAVPKLSISFFNCLYVISLNSPFFSVLNTYAGLSENFATDLFIISFKSVIFSTLYNGSLILFFPLILFYFKSFYYCSFKFFVCFYYINFIFIFHFVY